MSQPADAHCCKSCLIALEQHTPYMHANTKRAHCAPAATQSRTLARGPACAPPSSAPNLRSRSHKESPLPGPTALHLGLPLLAALVRSRCGEAQQAVPSPCTSPAHTDVAHRRCQSRSRSCSRSRSLSRFRSRSRSRSRSFLALSPPLSVSLSRSGYYCAFPSRSPALSRRTGSARTTVRADSLSRRHRP